MAEECRFYYYDNGYCCALKRQKEGYSSIDSDTVHKYCWGYHYEDCPRYKNEYSSSSGCYLTSACIEARRLSDTCNELQILRNFRDNYLSKTEQGKKEIAEYYLIAPLIVEKIKEHTESNCIFDTIFTELIEPCVILIRSGHYEQAHQMYKNYTLKLKNKYIL